MIDAVKTPYSEKETTETLNPLVRQWFFSRFSKFSLPQLFAVKRIHNLRNVLVSAPTGSTKTLTAFLSILNELVTLAQNNLLEDKTYCVYVSPLKALNNDIKVNLQQPLEEMEKLYGKKLGIRVLVRTGDTTASQRANMLKKPPHILITTPETLAIVLTTLRFKDFLKDTNYLIIDEVHALASNKRGVHLSLSVERLKRLVNNNIVKVGLSATISPLEEIAKFIVGKDGQCDIVDINNLKKMDLKVISPVSDLIETSEHELNTSMYDLVHKLIQEHKTTLIFTNTRSATERVVHTLKEKFPKYYNSNNIGAHHSSLSKEHRLWVEESLRKNKMKCVVCSTSLELGIDIGSIDLVILLGSPKSVNRCLQRVGRSGHSLDSVSEGRIIVTNRDDLVECSVLLKAALERKIDKIHIPKNCLDVLSQQIYGMIISEQMNSDDLYKMIKQSYCYSDLPRKDFDDVIDYLAGKYVSLEERNVYAKIWKDENTNMLGRKGKMSRIIFMTNVGTIPDETSVSVKVKDVPIGRIEESFLHRLKKGDVFVLGGNTYTFRFSRGQTAQVEPSGKAPTIPSWFSEMLPLSFDLANEINVFRKLMEEKFQNEEDEEQILDFINSYLYVDKNAAKAIYNYFKLQYLYLKEIPNSEKLLIEFYNEADKKYAIFHSLYGRKVNDVLSRAVAYTISKLQKRDVEIGINDNGFYIASNKNIQVLRAFQMLNPDTFRNLLEQALEKTEILKRVFRHCATRSLMILRTYKGRHKRVGRQQVSSTILLSAVKRISEDFPILKEAKREVLEDYMDIENAIAVLNDLKKMKIKVRQASTSVPSPFALNLLTQGKIDMLSFEDKLDFLKRMHQYTLAKVGKNVLI